MSYIKTIDENEAEGKLKVTYESIAGKNKKMVHVLKIQSLNPEAMQTHYELYRTIMYGKSSLSRAQREMIATVVSVQNCCFY
jgi:uncharacterized peroxidase-related enzyme